MSGLPERDALRLLDTLSGDYITSDGTPVVLAQALEAVGRALIALVEEVGAIRLLLEEQRR